MRLWAGWKQGRFSRDTGYNLILKAVTFFLVAMAVLAMFGRLKFPAVTHAAKKIKALKKPGTCKSCGAFRIGKGPCACGKE